MEINIQQRNNCGIGQSGSTGPVNGLKGSGIGDNVSGNTERTGIKCVSEDEIEQVDEKGEFIKISESKKKQIFDETKMILESRCI